MERFARLATHPFYWAALTALNVECALGCFSRGWWWSAAFFAAFSLWQGIMWPTIWRWWRERRW